MMANRRGVKGPAIPAMQKRRPGIPSSHTTWASHGCMRAWR